MELHRRLADKFRDDELKQLSVLPGGRRLERFEMPNRLTPPAWSRRLRDASRSLAVSRITCTPTVGCQRGPCGIGPFSTALSDLRVSPHPAFQCRIPQFRLLGH